MAKGKHGEGIYPADTSEELRESALRLLGSRLAQGWFYHDEAADQAERICQGRDGGAAWQFLLARSEEGYEYETVSLETLR